MKKLGALLVFVFLLPTIVFLPRTVRGLYNYGIEEGTRCSTCHVNPTGGMLRSRVGLDYALNNHSFYEAADSEPRLDFFIGENIQIGSDARFLYYYYDDDTLQSKSTFFTMQGALYLSATLGQNITLFFNNDFGFGGFGQNRELWGMIKRLPLEGYLKIGRFRVPYGLRIDDHTSYIKDRFGFGTGSQDNGVEFGFVPSTYFLNLSVTNGLAPTIPFDNNTYKAFTVSGGYLVRNFSLGSSYYFNRVNSFQEVQRAGIFGSVGISNFVLISELDYGQNEALITGDRIDLLAGYCEASYKVSGSCWIKAKYDYFDSDRAMADNHIQRISMGGSIFAFNLSELQMYYRINIEEPDINNNEFISQVHLFF